MNSINSVNSMIIWLINGIVYIFSTIINSMTIKLIIGIVVIIMNIVNNRKINTIWHGWTLVRRFVLFVVEQLDRILLYRFSLYL